MTWKHWYEIKLDGRVIVELNEAEAEIEKAKDRP